jgi:hypothetical protein
MIAAENHRREHVLHHVDLLADQEHCRQDAGENEGAGRQIRDHQQPAGNQRRTCRQRDLAH